MSDGILIHSNARDQERVCCLSHTDKPAIPTSKSYRTHGRQTTDRMAKIQLQLQNPKPYKPVYIEPGWNGIQASTLVMTNVA